jgi:uncharacterized damage-inducible protein DinB
MLQTVLRDVDADVLWKAPPGSANPIGAIYAHTVGIEDLYIQQIMQRKPLIWDEGGWGERLGRKTSPNLWETKPGPQIDLDAFLPYRRAVYTASELYIAGLGDKGLEKSLPFPGRDWSMSIAHLLTVVISHGTAHAGEIAAIKGVFGGKGLLY